MKITNIEITNYKAFHGTHNIAVGGKNLFIYGENGSGKSSFYYALKDFFQSSIEEIDLNDLENIFILEDAKGKTAIKVTFKPDNQGQNKKKTYQFTTTKNDSRETQDTRIRDGNSLKSFLTYKHLLAVHHLKKDDSINLFDLLVKGVLKHFKYSLTEGRELGEMWTEIEEYIGKETGRQYPINKKKGDVNGAIKRFNEAFGELFNEDSPEYILKHAGPFFDKFNHNIILKLRFSQVRPNTDYTSLVGAKVGVEIFYAGKSIKKPHLFLNEARLSAIAISIYLGMIKRHVQGIPCKVLFLDDIFIGLDISNRLPLLKILKSEFSDYQIFITTYDKPWFEYARSFLEGKSNWKTLEFYAQICDEGFEVPVIFDNQNLITKAEKHLQQCDYKAAAVYIRSAFEKIIRNHCEKKKKPVVFKSQLKKYTTEDFWKVIKNDLATTTKADVERYRALVLNPFSHYN
ncbi:MAG: AAA family ATPase, partial [Desulfobulbaceae bacterium]|nr:AAA family ATPase [Desulfobulbaceae bacterium]